LAADGLEKIRSLAARLGRSRAAADRALAATLSNDVVALLEKRAATAAATAAAAAAAAAAVEAARHDPKTYAAALAEALAAVRVLAAAGSEDPPPGWVWIACDACSKWRLVTAGCCGERGFDRGGVAFSCADNGERPDASCKQPDDWPSSTDIGGSDGEPTES
jgi:hypothetical protein